MMYILLNNNDSLDLLIMGIFAVIGIGFVYLATKIHNKISEEKIK